MQEDPSTELPPGLTRARRAFGWILTVVVAFAWAIVVRESAWKACWPQAEVARTIQSLALALPVLIIGAGALAMWRRNGQGDLLGYALVLGALWLPHSNFAISQSVNNWGKPHSVLKVMQTGQSLFREGDKDGDGTLDYGTLTELVEQRLIDEAHGKYMLRDQPLRSYRYRVHVSPKTPEFLWAAVANPAEPDPLSPEPEHALGYVANHEGIFAGLAPLEVDPVTCARPDGVFAYPQESEQVYGLLRSRFVSQNRFWRHRAPFGFTGTLAVLAFTLLGVVAWVFERGPFRPRPGSRPGEDDVAG